MGKCKFVNGWLNKKDIHGRTISTWAKKYDDKNAFCLVCSKPFCIEFGFIKFNQHAKGKQHAHNASLKLNPMQLQLQITRRDNEENNNQQIELVETQNDSKTQTTFQLISTRDKAAQLELQICLQIVCANWSVESCKGLGSFLKNVIPNNAIPDNFSLSSSKIRYIIKHALGPYCKKELLKDIGGNFYTIQYDETTNSESLKELHVSIRYFSDKLSKVVNACLETYFLGHAFGDTLSEHILKAIHDNGLLLKNCLMLGSDGPNVNKKVWRLINENVKEIRGKSLIDLGSCNIHIVHNSFLKGLKCFGLETSDFIISLYYFFHGWPTRVKDYEAIQKSVGVPRHHFIKHVPTRWLTLQPAIERTLEQWPSILNYFLVHIPKKGSKDLNNNKHYKIIKSFLSSPTSKPQLLFVNSVAKIFTKFTLFFQRDEPLVHVMFDKLQSLVFDLLSRICVDDVLVKFENLESKKMFESQNILSLDKINPGQECLNLLNEKEISERVKLEFLNKSKNFYIAAIQHIYDKIPHLKTTFKYLSFLNVKDSVSKKYNMEGYLVKCLGILPFDVDCDTVILQYKNLKADIINNKINLEERVDTMWASLQKRVDLDGASKYDEIWRVAKACLTLAHGNAEVERSFSLSKRILTEDKTAMDVSTLTSLLHIKDVMRLFYDNKPYLMLITKELLNMSRIAYKVYNDYLEQKKTKARQEEANNAKAEQESRLLQERQTKSKANKQIIDNLAKQLRDISAEKKETHKLSMQLVRDAQEKLKSAIRKKNFAEVSVAQVLLDNASKVTTTEENFDKKIIKLQTNILKRQNDLNTIDNFVTKKSKNNA